MRTFTSIIPVFTESWSCFNSSLVFCSREGSSGSCRCLEIMTAKILSRLERMRNGATVFDQPNSQLKRCRSYFGHEPPVCRKNAHKNRQCGAESSVCDQSNWKKRSGPIFWKLLPNLANI